MWHFEIKLITFPLPKALGNFFFFFTKNKKLDHMILKKKAGERKDGINKNNCL